MRFKTRAQQLRAARALAPSLSLSSFFLSPFPPAHVQPDGPHDVHPQLAPVRAVSAAVGAAVGGQGAGPGGGGAGGCVWRG